MTEQAEVMEEEVMEEEVVEEVKTKPKKAKGPSQQTQIRNLRKDVRELTKSKEELQEELDLMVKKNEIIYKELMDVKEYARGLESKYRTATNDFIRSVQAMSNMFVNTINSI